MIIFVVVYVSKTDIYQRTVHVASQNYDVINLIYNVIGVTWHHLQAHRVAVARGIRAMPMPTKANHRELGA